jgi:hypothetical protein
VGGHISSASALHGWHRASPPLNCQALRSAQHA